MNTLKDMILTEIEGEWYAVPVGEAAKRFSGMIRMNKTGKRIFELLMDTRWTKPLPGRTCAPSRTSSPALACCKQEAGCGSIA